MRVGLRAIFLRASTRPSAGQQYQRTVWQALARRARARPFDGETGPNDSTHATRPLLAELAWTAPARLSTLLRAERQGRQHKLMALRRQLQALNPVLFKAYMATR